MNIVAHGLVGAARGTRAVAIAAAVALLGACAAPGPAAPDPRTPQAIIAWANGARLAVHGSPDKALQARTVYMRNKCESQGGTLEATVKPLVFHDSRGGYTTYTSSINDFMSCEVAGEPAWGLRMSLEEPKVLVGGITSGMDFFGVFRLQYLDAQQTKAERDRRAARQQQLRAEAQECAAKVAQMREQLRTDPKIGQASSLGTIIDVRLPMVQVQYNDAARQLRHRDQEWLRASDLDAVRSCQ